MAEREDYDTRMQRLRAATHDLAPTQALMGRVLASIQRPAPELSIWDAVWILGRWAFLPAACAPVVLGVVLLAGGSWLDDAVFIASSVGWLP